LRERDVIGRLFVRTLEGLYFTAAFLSCFIACQADRIAVVMGGASFAPSAFALGLLVLSPLHQAYGQVSATVYYATGQTKKFRNLAIALHIGGIGMTWILIGPRAWYGLDLGSNGLALKFTLFQVIATNVFVFFNCRYLGISFRRLVGHQLLTPTLLLAFAIVARLLISPFPILGEEVPENLLRIASAGVIYVAFGLTTVIVMPSIAGLDRGLIGRSVGSLRARVWSRTKMGVDKDFC
jgi:hypothetical protein